MISIQLKSYVTEIYYFFIVLILECEHIACINCIIHIIIIYDDNIS